MSHTTRTYIVEGLHKGKWVEWRKLDTTQLAKARDLYGRFLVQFTPAGRKDFRLTRITTTHKVF